jgi:deazaflavin-dependent oxidoreductase (nitroreductase family)
VNESAKAPSGLGKKTYDATWGVVLNLTTRGHKFVHKVSGGRIGVSLLGSGQIIWITTFGRKSMQWRTTPLLAVPDGDATDANWVITGSNAGQAKVPGWVFNVRDRADGFAEINKRWFAVTYVEVTGAERDEMYERLKKAWKSYEMYERKSGRYIPVFRIVLGDEVPRESVPAPAR